MGKTLPFGIWVDAVCSSIFNSTLQIQNYEFIKYEIKDKIFLGGSAPCQQSLVVCECYVH